MGRGGRMPNAALASIELVMGACYSSKTFRFAFTIKFANRSAYSAANANMQLCKGGKPTTTAIKK